MRTYVILGRKCKNDIIHPILKKRLDTFIKIYKKGDSVILSGGKTPKNKHTEAYLMSKYIRKYINISKKNIITENKSLDTIDNICFTLKKINKNNIKSVTLITSSWHMKRVKLIVNFFNIYNIKFYYYSSKVISPINNDEKYEKNQEKNKILLFNKMYY